MRLGRKDRVELDPTVQFPRRRENDHDAALRAEEIAERAKAQAESHAWFTRGEVRDAKFGRAHYARNTKPKLLSFMVKDEDGQDSYEVRTPYGAKSMRLRRAAAKVARQARAANFRRLAVARRQRQKRRRQGR